MNKNEILTHLRDAKKAHVAWVTYANAMVEGLIVEEFKVPIHGTDCGFGKWYYGEGQVLMLLPEFKKIDAPHLKLHETYMGIYKLLKVRDKEDESSVFSRMMGSKRKLEAEKADALEKAHVLYKQLKAISLEVVMHLENLQEELMLMRESDLEHLLASQGMGSDASKA